MNELRKCKILIFILDAALVIDKLNQASISAARDLRLSLTWCEEKESYSVDVILKSLRSQGFWLLRQINITRHQREPDTFFQILSTSKIASVQKLTSLFIQPILGNNKGVKKQTKYRIGLRKFAENSIVFEASG